MEIAKMSAAQLKKAMDSASLESSKIVDLLIDAGRGNERPNDMMSKSDPLSLKYQKNSSLLQSLYAEKNRRQIYHGSLRPIKYQENPTMATKKFSPAQIAAQKLFAERARAGTLGKGKRKAAVKRKANPDKDKPNVYIKRVSQATGAPPTKRLVKRRTKALFAPAGYFPNPEPTHDFARIGKPFAFDGRTWKVSQYSHNGKTIEAYTTDRKKFVRRQFDVSELMSSRRKLNPAAAMMTGYQVIGMLPKKNVVGIFKTMARAKNIATFMADANGVPYGVKTVKVHKAHFAV